MVCGVIWRSGKDGASMIVSRWNANFCYILSRQALVHNPYYSAFYFMHVH
jgi:hypothetical protein